MANPIYTDRLDALAATWSVWADTGARLSDADWLAPTRCPGWRVADVYAHHSFFPRALSGRPPTGPARPGPTVTAVEILQGFNRPGGVASTLASTVALGAVADASARPRADLVDRFAVVGPATIDALRAAPADRVVPWPPASAPVALVEALRIVLLEATVHLLDVQRALRRAPAVPRAALAETAQLLAEIAPPVELIESATGRTATAPFPVLR